jgi:hypothetical protein
MSKLLAYWWVWNEMELKGMFWSLYAIKTDWRTFWIVKYPLAALDKGLVNVKMMVSPLIVVEALEILSEVFLGWLFPLEVYS